MNDLGDIYNTFHNIFGKKYENYKVELYHSFFFSFEFYLCDLDNPVVESLVVFFFLY